jgi:folate-dependent phosphoribosylglycinamide formyltransferase PurN
MRLFMLSGCDPSARYMVGKLREAGLLERLYQVVWTEPPARPPRRRRDYRRVARGIARRLEDGYLDWRFERLQAGVSRALFGSDEPPPVEVDDSVAAREVNSPSFAQRLAALEPDVLLLHSAPLLKPLVYQVPRVATLNVHYGIAPTYRGNFALFWALYHGDYDHLGATLHHVDPGIDSGAIVGHAYPELSPDDSEATVIARCARAATDMVVAHLRGAAEPSDQAAPSRRGRNYKKRERGPWRDGHLWLKRRLGLVRLPPRDRRAVLYE